MLLSQHLFQGLAKLADDKTKQSFPYPLSLPTFLGLENDRVWVFPFDWLFKTPTEQQSLLQVGRRANWAFDFAQGRIRSIEEIHTKYASKDAARNAVRLARRAVDEATNTARHPGRLYAAMAAQNAFVDLFVAATGQPLSVVAEIPWSDSFSVGRSTVHGFRSIKWRARKRRMYFVVAGDFVPLFRRFIRLRKFILKKANWPYLFFSADLTGGVVRPKRLVVTAHNILYLHRRLAPNVKFLGCAKWKAAKSNRIADKHGIEIGAQVAQNTKRVFGQHYVTGTDNTAIRQMGTWFAEVHDKVKSSRADAIGRESSVGECSDFGEPVPLGDDIPATPDCSQPEGCLFCSKHYLIADEKDIRKLASCRYCINETKSLSGSHDLWRETFNPILERIDHLLALIASKSDAHSQLVNRVVFEVENEGELDLYWEAKLEMLSNLQLGATR
ncbi:hypothetical protein DO72_878 [Burkholderia pseudomallei]|nr:hypothetical protein DO72_878 [Burkholderia pseudomallei]